MKEGQFMQTKHGAVTKDQPTQMIQEILKRNLLRENEIKHGPRTNGVIGMTRRDKGGIGENIWLIEDGTKDALNFQPMAALEKRLFQNLEKGSCIFTRRRNGAPSPMNISIGMELKEDIINGGFKE